MKRVNVGVPCVLILVLTTQVSCTKCDAEKPTEHVRVLRFGHDGDEGSAMQASVLEIATEVEVATHGALKVEVYPAQKLGTDPAMIEMARAGELDIILPPTAKLGPIIPQMSLLDLPFFIPDEATLYKMVDGRVGQKLFEQLAQKDLTGVAFWSAGAKQFTSDFEINSPRDFLGKKMRVMRSPMIMRQFELLGAKPVVIDYFETHKALEDKQVDGQENPIASILNMKFYDVQKYLTMSSHAFLMQAVVVSNKTLESLPQEQRDILLAKIRELTPRYRNRVQAEQAQALETIKKSPIQIRDLSPVAREEMRAAMWDLAFTAADDIGPDLMKMAYEDIGVTPPLDNALIVGLDADMSGPSAISGQAIERGLQLAIQEINVHGGVSGRRIRLLTKDHQAVAARAASDIDAFVKRGDVKAIFAGLQSSVIVGSLPSMQKVGIPFLVSWATAMELTNNGLKPNPVFRLSARDDSVGPFLAQTALKHSNKIALVLENSVWGHGNEVGVTKELTRMHVKPAAVSYVNVGQKEFIETMKAVEGSGAEVVVMVLNPAEGKDFVLTRLSRTKHIPVVSHWGITGGTFGKDLASQLKNFDFAFFQTPGFLGNKRVRAVDLARRYLETYGGGEVADINAPAAVIRTYDMMMLLGQALELAEKSPKLSMREALEKVSEFDGAVTTYRKPFANALHEGFDPKLYTLGRFDDKGRIVPVTSKH